MAFCTDEVQLRQAYQKAIRVYFLALLMSRNSIGIVTAYLHSLLKRLFDEVVQNEPANLHKYSHDHESYVMENVNVFVEVSNNLVGILIICLE
jgi:hypothetical protein